MEKNLLNLQSLESMAKLESLTKLHTIQMEGNPVWSHSDYSNYVVSSLPHLKVLDQQEISAEISEIAAKWKSSQAPVMAVFYYIIIYYKTLHSIFVVIFQSSASSSPGFSNIPSTR